MLSAVHFVHLIALPFGLLIEELELWGHSGAVRAVRRVEFDEKELITGELVENIGASQFGDG